VHYLLSRDITLFTFDFAGCGLSEGEYISLGYFERGDVDTAFKYLRGLGTVSSIGIWGRSMGAVTALMYADTNHEIGCLVLDSPFSNLEKLSKELAEKHGGGLSIFSGIALSFLKSTIKEKVNLSLVR
jgi:alpha/beta superfamily hydrolase